MSQATGYQGRDVFIVDGARTPFLKARGPAGPFSATDLAVHAGLALLNRQPFDASAIDEVVVGCVGPRETEANIARLVALRLGCGDYVPAYSVQRNCASGIQALDSAAKDIAAGRAEMALAGGTEAMSHAPMVAHTHTTNWLMRLAGSRSFKQRMQTILQFRPNMLSLDHAIRRALKDPVVGLSMGQTAENLAEKYGITRMQMDEYAARSHERAANAQASASLTEIVPIIDSKGNIYDKDDGVRLDSTVEKLAKLKPVFDPRYGNITAGNSSQVTDGAAMLLLASADAVKKYQLPIMAKIVDCNWAALDPAMMGLGPVCASIPILKRNKLGTGDIDFWEINEAFAAQVLACQAAWEDPDLCASDVEGDKKIGPIDEERLNIDGGAVAMGHPVGASGARIVLHMCHILADNNAKRGIASACIGGGQGGAMMIERVS